MKLATASADKGAFSAQKITTLGALATQFHEQCGLASAWMHLQIPMRSVGIWSLQFVWALWVPPK
jgi:hypothetical protein